MKDKSKKHSLPGGEDSHQSVRKGLDQGQGYDEDRELGLGRGYREPGARRTRSPREHLSRALSRKREDARKFWSFFARYPEFWDEIPENERVVLRDLFSLVEVIGPNAGAKSQPAKRPRRSRHQVINDLADDWESNSPVIGRRRGRPRVKYALEVRAEIQRREQARAQGKEPGPAPKRVHNKQGGIANRLRRLDRNLPGSDQTPVESPRTLDAENGPKRLILDILEEMMQKERNRKK